MIFSNLHIYKGTGGVCRHNRLRLFLFWIFGEFGDRHQISLLANLVPVPKFALRAIR